MLKIDVHTIETLQLLAPGVSKKDRTAVEGLVVSGGVFSDFSSSERASIWRRMKKRKAIIPSLHTFFQDLWYLESCANCMKRLVIPSKMCPTVKTAMLKSFEPAEPFVIQTSETGFRRCSVSQADCAELAYRQLWLYAMRHYTKLPKKPEKDDPVAKAQCEKADETVLYDMAVFARRLGFHSPDIEELIKKSPDHQIARNALLRARKPDRYRYDSATFESLASQIAGCFHRAIPLNYEPSSETVNCMETHLNSRCGHPHEKAQKQDCPFLFIDQVHMGEDFAPGKVTTLFVRQCVYFVFFGKLPSNSLPHSSTVEDSPSLKDLPMSPLFVDQTRHPDPGSSGRNASFDPSPHFGGNNDRQHRKEVRRELRRQKRKENRRRRRERPQNRSRTESQPRTERSHSSAAPNAVLDVDSDMSSIAPAAMELSSLSGDVVEWTALDRDEPLPQGEEAGMIEDETGQTPHQTEMAAAEAADSEHFHGEIEQEADTEQTEQERLFREAAERAEQERMAREAAEQAEQERHPARPVTQIDFTALQQDPLHQKTEETANIEHRPVQLMSGIPATGFASGDSPGQSHGGQMPPRRVSGDIRARAEEEGTLSPVTASGIQAAEPTSSQAQITQRHGVNKASSLAQQAKENRSKKRRGILSRPRGIKATREKAKQTQGPAERVRVLRKHRRETARPSSVKQEKAREKISQNERPSKRVTQINFTSVQQPTESDEALPATEQPSHVPLLEAISEDAPQIQHPESGPQAGEAIESVPLPLGPPKDIQELPAGEQQANVETQPCPSFERADGPAATEPADSRIKHVTQKTATSSHGRRISRHNGSRPLGIRKTKKYTQGQGAQARARTITEAAGKMVVQRQSRLDQDPKSKDRLPEVVAGLEPMGRVEGTAESQPESLRVAIESETGNRERILRAGVMTPGVDIEADASANTPVSGIRTRPRLRPHVPVGKPAKASAVQRRTPGTASERVTIIFKTRSGSGEWDTVVHELVVDQSDPSPVERIAKKDARNRKAIFYDKSLRTIPPTQCFDAAIEDGTNTIFIAFGDELAVDEEAVASVSRALGTEPRRQAKRHQEDKPS